MFASKIRQEVEVDGGSVTIRKLSFSKLDQARDARQLKSATTIKTYGGEVLKVLRDESTADLTERLKARKEDPEVARKARYLEYDRLEILHAGVVSFNGEAAQIEQIDDLVDEVAQKIFEAIIDLSAPPPDVQKAEQEKG